MPQPAQSRSTANRANSTAGTGKQLLIHALNGIAEANRKVGFEVLVVDAIDDAAVTFYARFGFTRFESHPRKRFLPMKNLLATLAASKPV